MFVLGKYFIVDFKDGPQVIQGAWITKDRRYCAWSPQFEEMDPLTYDKIVQDSKNKPTNDWVLHEVVRVRAYGGNSMPTHIY